MAGKEGMGWDAEKEREREKDGEVC